MPIISAGILLYRYKESNLEVFLVHPGGPFWAGKDDHAWSIPKGLLEPDENPLEAAKREFEEETGLRVSGKFTALRPLKQPGGKLVMAWAVKGDADPTAIQSNAFTMEWPPRSGRTQEFPEVDRAGWFPLDTAKKKLFKGQVGFIDELKAILRL